MSDQSAIVSATFAISFTVRITAVNVVASQESSPAGPGSIAKSITDPPFAFTTMEYPRLKLKTDRWNASTPSTKICPIVPSPHVPICPLAARIPLMRNAPPVSAM